MENSALAEPYRNHYEEVTTMAGIGWETDFEKALQKTKETKKPLFQDFWFDG